MACHHVLSWYRCFELMADDEAGRALLPAAAGAPPPSVRRHPLLAQLFDPLDTVAMRNVYVMGIGFLLLFAAYNTVQVVISSYTQTGVQKLRPSHERQSAIASSRGGGGGAYANGRFSRVNGVVRS